MPKIFKRCMVKGVLVLPHCNADVEREVSINNHVLTSKRYKQTPPNEIVNFSDPRK